MKEKNTISVIKWFKNIKDTQLYKFIMIESLG